MTVCIKTKEQREKADLGFYRFYNPKKIFFLILRDFFGILQDFSGFLDIFLDSWDFLFELSNFSFLVYHSNAVFPIVKQRSITTRYIIWNNLVVVSHSPQWHSSRILTRHLVKVHVKRCRKTFKVCYFLGLFYRSTHSSSCPILWITRRSSWTILWGTHKSSSAVLWGCP